MEHEIRPIAPGEVEAFRAEITATFGGDLSDEERSDDQRFRDVMPLDRTRAAFDGNELVGTLGDFPMEVTVPGGAFVPMAGTTMISVRPSHTRRGILKAMIRSHLDAARSEGRPLAGLWASEFGIYGRYGFGSATDRLAAKLPADAADLPEASTHVRVRQVSVAEALELFPVVHEQVRADRPGMLGRSTLRWKWRFHDPVSWRNGMSAWRLVLCDGASGPVGFAAYRVKEVWEDSVARGKVYVDELQAVTSEAHSALWKYLTTIDLFPRVSYWNLPVDDPLRWKVRSPRGLQQPIQDALWLRLLDVPAALTARRYAGEGAMTITVTDEYYEDLAGSYRLEVGREAATCERTSTGPDLRMSIGALAMVYLGGRGVATLAAAGLIEGDDSAIAMADRMFAWHRAPWCSEVF